MNRQSITKLTMLAVVAVVLLSSCFGALGGPPAPTVADIEPYEIDGQALTNFSTSASDSPDAQGMITAAQVFATTPLLYVEIALAGWDESQSATYVDESGTYTTTWGRDGDTWTWTMTFGSGMEETTITITVTALDDGWDVVVAIDGETLLDGLYNGDGTSGLVNFYAGIDQYVIEWGASDNPAYDLNYTVKYYSDGGSVDRELILDYTTDGLAGAWVYTDYTDTTPDDSGTWS